MGVIVKFSASVAVLALAFGYIVHSPIPQPVPDSFHFQILVDILSTSEVLASASEWLGINRWWSYPGNIPVPLPYFPPDTVEIDYLEFAGVESVVIIPKAFKERKSPGPAIVFYHGGGWVFGNLPSYISLLVQAAEETGFLVFSPEYRRAPKYPFPIPYEDCLNSSLNFVERAKEFNVDPNNIAFSGDSAGGNLAMAITLQLLRMKKEDPSVRTPAMLNLIYPVLQMGNFRLPSHQQNQEFIFSSELIPKFWLAYIGLNDRLDLAEIVAKNGHIDRKDAKLLEALKGVSGDAVPEKYKARGYNSTLYPLTKEQKSRLSRRVLSLMRTSLLDSRIAPLMVTDDELSALPRTHILVCEYDAIRDDGVLLHERLKSLKKAVTFQHLPNSLHATANVGAYFTDGYYAKQNRIMFGYVKKYMNSR